MKKSIITSAIIMIILLLNLIGILPDKSEVKAMELTTFSYANVEGSSQRSRVQTYYNASFAEARAQECGIDQNVSIIEGRTAYLSGAHDWQLSTTCLRFKTTGLPADIEVVKIYFLATVADDKDTGDWAYTHFYSLYKGADYSLCGWDYFFRNMQRDRLTSVVSSAQYSTNSTIEFLVPESEWDFILEDSDGEIHTTFTPEYVAMNWSPGAPISDADTRLLLSAISLKIDYVEKAVEYVTDYDTNDDDDTTILGTEVADNITWGSTRNHYSDQAVWLKVNGDSGANVTVQLIDTSGNILASSGSETIKVDDNYDFVITDLPSTFDGFIRARETIHNLLSTWGYVAPVPDSSQATNRVYAEYTDYTQYRKPFTGYVVNRGDLLFYHWKTNIDGTTANLSAYQLELWERGESSDVCYSSILSDIAENYLMGTVNNQEKNIHWRYMIFTPQFVGGQSPYSNLVQTLDLNFEPDNKGFIQAVITDNESAEYASTHSAYWYLSDAENGIAIRSKYSNYAVGQNIELIVTIGLECNVETDLNTATVSYYDSSDDSRLAINTFTVIEGENTFYLNGTEIEGSYYARVALGSDSITYEYIFDLDFTVSGDESVIDTDEDGILSSFVTWLDGRGLDNSFGHWLVIIIAMVATFVLLYKSPILRVVVPMFIAGLGIIIGWVDIWVIILLALGAGLTIFSILRRRMAGGSEGDD